MNHDQIVYLINSTSEDIVDFWNGEPTTIPANSYIPVARFKAELWVKHFEVKQAGNGFPAPHTGLTISESNPAEAKVVELQEELEEKKEEVAEEPAAEVKLRKTRAGKSKKD